MLPPTQFRLVVDTGRLVDKVVDTAVLTVVDRLVDQAVLRVVDRVVDRAMLRLMDRRVDSVHQSRLQAQYLQAQLAHTLDKVPAPATVVLLTGQAVHECIYAASQLTACSLTISV